jgi:hypothetical protein
VTVITPKSRLSVKQKTVFCLSQLRRMPRFVLRRLIGNIPWVGGLCAPVGYSTGQLLLWANVAKSCGECPSRVLRYIFIYQLACSRRAKRTLSTKVSQHRIRLPARKGIRSTRGMRTRVCHVVIIVQGVNYTAKSDSTAPKKAAPKPDLMIKLEPNLITVRAVFAHPLSPEIIGNMLN